MWSEADDVGTPPPRDPYDTRPVMKDADALDFIAMWKEEYGQELTQEQAQFASERMKVFVEELRTAFPKGLEEKKDAA